MRQFIAVFWDELSFPRFHDLPYIIVQSNRIKVYHSFRRILFEPFTKLAVSTENLNICQMKITFLFTYSINYFFLVSFSATFQTEDEKKTKQNSFILFLSRFGNIIDNYQHFCFFPWLPGFKVYHIQLFCFSCLVLLVIFFS